MAKSYSISFEQAAVDTPLKILPKNTWVKINNFKNPCRLLEISAQSLTIDVKSEPETLALHAGQRIKVQLLNISEEKPFELLVTIFHINDEECLCQIPLYVNNEQILVDKIILEIQKNEIGVKKTPNSARTAKKSDNNEEQPPLVPTDENIAPILNNLIAMLPDETKDNKEEQVTANKLTDIPKSTYNYQQLDLSKLFDDAHEKPEAEENEEEERYEYGDENEFDYAPAPKLPPRVHPLTLLRYSIVNKFLLDNLEDQYPEETAALNDAQFDVSAMTQNDLEQGIIPKQSQPPRRKKKKIKELKKNMPPDDIGNFLPSNLIEEMSMPDFMANIDKTNEYNYSLGNQKKPVDKDAAFEQYYEFSEDIPPELLFELMQKAKKRKEEYEGLDTKYQTDEYGFTVADEENFEGKNDDFVMGKFDDMLKNKRVIKWNINEDSDFVAKTDEEKDKEFMEKLNSQNQDKITADKSTFKFKIDI